MEEEKGKLIYILPNFFTAASAFLAVISIISTIKGNFSAAIFYIACDVEIRRGVR